MGNRIRNANRGITRTPELYDAYDRMYHTFNKTVNGTTILPGIYKGKVLNVRRSLDPDSIYMYEVLVWMPDINTSVDEPEVYTDLSEEDLRGLKYYYPISYDVDEPCVGMTVNMFIEDPSNAIGYYHSISSIEFDIKGKKFYSNIKQKSKDGPRKALEEGK